MAKRLVRVGPSAGSGGAATVYTAPSGTTAGSSRGGRLIAAVFANSSGVAGVHSLSVGTLAAATVLIPTGKVIATQAEIRYSYNVPLAPGDTIQALGTSGTVSFTLTVEEYILEA